MIRLALASVADTAIIPLAGYPGAGQQRPHEHAGNIRGKLGLAVPEGPDRPPARDRLAGLTAVYSRWNGAIPEGKDPHRKTEGPVQAAAPEPILQSTLKRLRECKKSNADFRHEVCRKEP